MYALFEIKGKQYKAEKGKLLKIDQVELSKGESIEFSSVLMVGGTSDIRIGSPYVEGVSVKAVVEDHKKDKKVVIYRYRPKKASKRKYGHRQPVTLIRIEEIAGIKE
jgi:large subunit ribosomal protein L21